ncbi:erythromycin esterase family protein [Saccharothrix coeruleofusca]|uniref:Erythromycin esterase n=1 Tax=Saccharothrix coeruleofusca TaxID=33919 RepID=A0A918AX52_9PSEU|nr:erythromycin esterase family protein [Saccharothrix coeruleofusca]GGP83177.1 erythromycin esterase [Saccharothrix coeruleofusca]
MTVPLQDVGLPFAAEDAGPAFAKFLHSLPDRPRLLGLGEALHGAEALLRLRNRVFRHLVEHEGYRSIAVESDCLAGLVADGFVAGAPGSLDQVMREGFSHGFGRSQANRELVAWMREHNRGRAEADRLRFFGFDAPIEMMWAHSPRKALTALHRYLSAHAVRVPCEEGVIDRLLGDDERWTDEAAALDPSRSVGARAEVGELRLIVDDLRAALVAEAPRLIAATSRHDWWVACLRGRAAAGLLRYHAGMADTSDARLPRLMDLREAMMAENLCSIVDAEWERGPTLVFAHNRHLQKDPSRWQLARHALEWWSSGAIVGAQRGEQYAFVATALGTAPGQGVGAPPAGTLEDVLARLPGEAHLVDSASLAATLREAGVEPAARVGTSRDHSYFALDPARLDGSDAIAFLKRL